MKNDINYVVMANENMLKNSISTIRKEQVCNKKIRGGRCFYCNFIHSIGRTTRGTGKGTTRITTPSNPLGVFLCEYHSNIDNCLFGYSFEFFAVNGKPTRKHISHSIEFETVENTQEAVVTMVKDYGFCPTADCTVQVEYKSPIYLSLQGFTKAIGGIENLINNEKFKVNHRCGTHLHTSIYSGIDENGKPIPKYDYTLLGRSEVYEKLFFPVCVYLDGMPHNKLLEYFGSDFRGYAENPIHNRMSNYCSYHSAIFNVQHEYSLEFRLPRFSTAEQYRKIAAFMEELVCNVALFQENEATAQKVGILNLETAKKYFPY